MTNTTFTVFGDQKATHWILYLQTKKKQSSDYLLQLAKQSTCSILSISPNSETDIAQAFNYLKATTPLYIALAAGTSNTPLAFIFLQNRIKKEQIIPDACFFINPKKSPKPDFTGFPPFIIQIEEGATNEALLQAWVVEAKEAAVMAGYHITPPKEALHLLARAVRLAIYKHKELPLVMDFTDLSERIAQHATQRPTHIAVKDGTTTLTWAALDKRVNQVAHLFQSLGIQAGDRIGVLAENSTAYLEVFLGTLRAGCCIVPLSGMATSATLELMCKDAAIKAFFISEKFQDLVAPLANQINIRFAFDFENTNWQSYETKIKVATATPFLMDYDPRSEFDIIYSSGTTGIPKGIIHLRDNRSNQCARALAFGFWPETICLLSTPLYSNTTMMGLLPTLAHGSTLILMRKFDVKHFLELSVSEAVTHTVLVPVQLQRVLSYPDFDKYDLSKYLMKLTTSAPLSPALKTELITRWPGYFIEVYGMTEGGVVTVLVANDYPHKVHTVGRAPLGFTLKVIDEAGKELPVNEIGELVGNSYSMMAGYHNRPDAMANNYWTDQTGMVYQRSGDYGKIDEEGFISLHGRKKEVIISGGFNIYAVDLEEVLKKHEAVMDAAVVGIPSATWGETPLGLVEVKAGYTIDLEHLKAWANAQLGKTQRLSAIEIREQLPRSPIGKILKKVLRKKYWEI